MIEQEENTLGSREEFQHIITGHVRQDRNGKDYVKFSTYLSFLQLTFRVYAPTGQDKVRVYVDFRLKRRGENADGTERESLDMSRLPPIDKLTSR